jgi:hypothetical protein
MNRIVCTIVTPDFLTRAAALMLSIRALGANCRYVILATEPVPMTLAGAEILTPDVLCDPDGLVASIIAKYRTLLADLHQILTRRILIYC